MNTTRREFLHRSAAAGVSLAVPLFSTGRSGAGEVNDRPTLAAIGVGGSRGALRHGTAIARRAAQFGRMIAVCDVDDRHAAEFNSLFDGQLRRYRDYRELLEKEKSDVVTIGTPDHWHVPIAIAAMRAGCDVYVEKPLTLTIEEGLRIRRVVEETGQVCQVGTQQRSEYGMRFLRAAAIVRSGRLGRSVHAYVALGTGATGGPFDTAAVPDDLDWDLWLGPAPRRDYAPERQATFRNFLEHAGGQLTNWGSHHIDSAQWALDCDHTGPIRVRGKGSFPPFIPDDFDWQRYFEGGVRLPNSFNVPTEFEIDLEFANGAHIHVSHHHRREDGTDFSNGILFEGQQGRIFVNRQRLSGKPVEDLTQADKAEIAERMEKIYKGKHAGNHMQNFFECIRDRMQPISDVATHHRTMTSCHLGNISLWLGRELRWDPEKEQFPDDPEAQALVSRARREPYHVVDAAG